MKPEINREFVIIPDAPEFNIGDYVNYNDAFDESAAGFVVGVECYSTLEYEGNENDCSGYVGFSNWHYELLMEDGTIESFLESQNLSLIHSTFRALPLPKFKIGDVVTKKDETNIARGCYLITGIQWGSTDDICCRYLELIYKVKIKQLIVLASIAP